jgi:hypothetical protein
MPTERRCRAFLRIHWVRAPSKSASGPMRCTKLRRALTSTRTPSPGRPSARRATRVRRERRWPGCISAAQGFDAPRRKAQPLVAGFTIFAAEDRARSWKTTWRRGPRWPQARMRIRRRRCARAAARRSTCSRPFTPRCGRFFPRSSRCGRTTTCTPRICFGAMRATRRGPWR